MTTIRQRLHWYRNLHGFRKTMVNIAILAPILSVWIIFAFEIDQPPRNLDPARYQELYQQATAGNVDAQYALADAYWVHSATRGSYDFDYFDNILSIAWHRIAARNCHTPSQEFLDSAYYRLHTRIGTGWWANGAVDDIQQEFPKASFGNCTE